MRGIATSLLLVSALRGQASQASGWYFGNSNVLQLLREGRSDTGIMARIARENTVIFKFETEDLMALKNAGASLGVLSAMLARARQSSGSSFAPDAMQTFKSLKAETLTLVARQGQSELEFSRGEYVFEGYGSHPALHLDYPGLQASIRTTDPRPSLLIRFASDPTPHYYMAKLSASPKKNIRGFRVKQRLIWNGFQRVYVPEKAWMTAYTATEEEKGIWRITPQADLEPGEYGLLDGVRLFEFGVDRP
jgi:hypothetical protein